MALTILIFDVPALPGWVSIIVIPSTVGAALHSPEHMFGVSRRMGETPKA
jgi:hypothetical protein